MSFQSDLIIALSSVANDQIYIQMAPAEIDGDFIVYRVLSDDPVVTMQGPAGMTNYSLAFDCYADTYLGSIALAESVKTAVDSSSLTSFRQSSPGEDYEPIEEKFLEPVYYGFWY